MLPLVAGNLAGGLLGMGILALLCGSYGFLLLGVMQRDGFHSLIELCGFYVLIGFVGLSWIGALLAVASLFYVWLFIPIALAVAMAMRRWGPRIPHLEHVSATPWILQFVLLLGLGGAALVFAWPAETFILFDDASVYTIAGINLAESGTLIPTLETFVCRGHYALRYWGHFRWWDPCHPELSIGFLPLPKQWGAIASWLFGRGGTVWITPFVSLLGIWTLFGLARRTIGWLSALATIMLLSIAFPQVWLSRQLMSETFTQVACFGGLYLLYLERQTNTTERTSVLGIAAALSISLLSLVRFEAGLIVGLLTAGWLLSIYGSRKSLRVRWPLTWLPHWLLLLLIFSLVGLALSFVVAPHYYIDSWVKTMTKETLRLLIVVALIGGGVLYGLYRHGVKRLWQRIQTWPFAQIGFLGLAILWAVVAGADLLLRGTSSSGISSWLMLYLSLPGLLLGLAGVIWLSSKRHAPEIDALLFLALISALGYTARPLVTRVHPWAIRRFVPAVVPALALGSGALFGSAYHIMVRIRSRLLRWPATALLAIIFAVTLFFVSSTTLPFLTYRDTAGLWDQLEELADLYPEDALLIFDDGPIGQRMPQVMELVFNRGVISYFEPPGPAAMKRLEELIKEERESGRRVFLNVIDGNILRRSEQLSLKTHGAYTIDVPRMMYEPIPPPTAASVGRLHFLVDIYEIVPVKDLASHYEPSVDIPLGQGSYPYLESGFHRAETDSEDRMFRWTEEDASITVPLPRALYDVPLSVQITFELASWRPENVDPTEISVQLGGETVLETQVEHRFEPQPFFIEHDGIILTDRDSLRIELESNTWEPAEHDISDDRALGVAVYSIRVAVEPMGSASQILE